MIVPRSVAPVTFVPSGTLDPAASLIAELVIVEVDVPSAVIDAGMGVRVMLPVGMPVTNTLPLTAVYAIFALLVSFNPGLEVQ